MWLSLVERYVRDVEVASSNLVISTKKEKTPTGCLFFFDYDYDFNLQYYARATKLYHRALCLERERARWAMKRARQGNKQGVAQPIGRDTTMFMTERGHRSRKFAYPVRRSPSSLGRHRTWVSRSVATLPCHLDQSKRAPFGLPTIKQVG